MTKDEFLNSLAENIEGFKSHGWPIQFGKPFYDLCKEFNINPDELKEELLNDSRHS